jgi:hypothetical protein
MFNVVQQNEDVKTLRNVGWRVLWLRPKYSESRKSRAKRSRRSVSNATNKGVVFERGHAGCRASGDGDRAWKESARNIRAMAETGNRSRGFALVLL